MQLERAAREARLLARGEQDASVGVGRDDGRDVTALRDDAAAAREAAERLLRVDQRTLQAAELGADLEVRRDRADLLRDPGRADVLTDVVPVDEHRLDRRVDAQLERHRAHGLSDRVAVSEVETEVQAPPGRRAVRRARVEVREAETAGDRLRHARLA